MEMQHHVNAGVGPKNWIKIFLVSRTNITYPILARLAFVVLIVGASNFGIGNGHSKISLLLHMVPFMYCVIKCRYNPVSSKLVSFFVQVLSSLCF